ncbi:MAG TPA: hypothetical protein VFU22_16065 [Roseiflexaceae bacterium]|nr:hypothetical protein [Roseiflexaceae bacterium]
MHKLQHDDMHNGADIHIASQNAVQRLARWFGRAIGRSCVGGLWTLSPDGKLRCEALRGQSCQTD